MEKKEPLTPKEVAVSILTERHAKKEELKERILKAIEEIKFYEKEDVLYVLSKLIANATAIPTPEQLPSE